VSRGNVRQSTGPIHYWRIKRETRDGAYHQGYQMARFGRTVGDGTDGTYKQDDDLKDYYGDWYDRGWQDGRTVRQFLLTLFWMVTIGTALFAVWAFA
jgi:hypothetical protein